MLVVIGLTNGLAYDYNLFEARVPGINIAE
jgi:hypothetical protein